MNPSPSQADFLQLIGHSLRWKMLKSLAHSDRRVSELVAEVRRPQNVVSYHLNKLRAGDVVHERRSSADAREVYYSLNLEGMRAAYLTAGAALHPALGCDTGSGTVEGRAFLPLRVLFLCTHNSARSQMAEALLRARTGGELQVYSAGSEPSEVHPLAVEVMAARRLDIRDRRAKSFDEFLDQAFDVVITVCDRAREVCPVFPGAPEQLHWSLPDPAAVEGDAQAQRRAFEETAAELERRIRYFLAGLRAGGK